MSHFDRIHSVKVERLPLTRANFVAASSALLHGNLRGVARALRGEFEVVACDADGKEICALSGGEKMTIYTRPLPAPAALTA